MYTTKDLDAFFAAPMQPVQPRKTLLPAARTQMDQGNTGLGDPMQQPEEEMGVGGYALDVLSSVPKGIVNSARDVAELANLPLQAAGLTEEIPEYFGLFEPPKTAAGAVVDTMVGFFTGYGAVAKGLGVAGRIGGIGMKASKYARAAEIAAMQSMGTKAAKAVNIGKNFAKTAATSAITSGLVFDGNEERLSNLLREYGGFTDPVTEYLAADENDTEIEGRFKNVIEDFLTGGAVELATQLVKPFVRSTVNSVRIHRAGVKAKLAGRNPDEAITREAFRLSEEQAETLARSMNVTMDESKGILRMIDATGAARENFAFMTRTEAKEYLERLGQRSDEIEAEARGFATINEAGKVIIGGLKGADFDTAIHEVAHGIRMMVVDPAVANKVLRSEDIDVLANFAGAVKKTDGSYQWTREAEEKFVASYERYLYEGVFPDRSTRRVFNQLTGWARNIYAQENVSAAALSPDVRNAFDNLVNNGVETTLGKGNGIAGDVLLQSRRPNQFYSALSQSIEGLTTKAFSPSSLNQQFKSLVNSGAVKQAEIDWSGVKEWSAMQEGKVTKESVLDFLQNNGVRVETRELGLFTPEVTQFDEAYKKAKAELESVIKEAFPQGDQGRDLLTAEAVDVERLLGGGEYQAGIQRRQIDAINRILNEPGARERFAAAELDQFAFDEDGPVPVGGPDMSSEESLSVLNDYIEEFTRYGDRDMAARFKAIRDLSPRNLSSESAVSEEAFSKYLDALDTAEEAKKALLKAKKVNGPKWSVYQLEGEKSDYREILLKLPVKPSPSGAGRIEQLENGLFLVSYPRLGDSVFPTRAEAEADLASKQGLTQFTKHWDDKNVLVHLRMNDRVDADGKRVLFIEEFQSDWAQAGREIGFKPTSERRAAIEQEYRDAELAFKSATPETEAAAQERFDAAMDVYNKEINDASIVRAPFVEKTSGWVDLGLKQVLLEAIRGGYDRVAFINGDQSVARFKKDLTEKVDSVSIVRNENGTYDFKAIKEGNQAYSESGIKGEQLSRVMGKYASAQLIDLADSNPGKVMELASDEIEVGGKGMREFYDSILPLAMDKLLKKYGGSKTGKLEIVKDFDRIRADAERMGMGFEDALDLIDESDFPVDYSVSQVSFDVTPGLKDGVSPGLPLFQARRGLTEGKTPGRLQPPEGELNYGRASTIAQLNESIEANYEEKLKAIRSQPETLEMSLASAEVARRSVANALNLDNFNSFEAFDAKTPGSSAAIQESRRAIIAHRQILADVGLLVFNRARAYQTANPEEMYEFLRGEQIMRYTSYKVKGMVAEIARGLSGQRMVLEPNPDFRLLPDVSQVFETGFPQTPQLGGLGYPDEAAILEGVAGRPPASARGGMEARQGESVQVAPDLEFRDSRKSIVEATVEQAGGADAVRRRMKEYALQGASGDPLSVVKYASGARYGSAMLEYFMNSILSSPVTQTVNALGNTLTSYYIPLERALGATIRGDMVTAAQQLSHVRHLNHSWGYAVKMMGAAFKANRNVLDNVGTVEVRGNAISSDLLVPVAQRFGYGKETLQNMGLAWAADKIGVLINTPTRTLMAADEMFKQLNYRAALMTELEIEGLKRFEGDSVAAAQWAGDTIDQMLVNGQRYAETAVLERANQLADAAVAGGRIAPENRVRFVAAYMSNGDNWDPSLGVLSDRALDLSRYATFSTPLSTVNDTKLGRFSAHIQRAVDVHPVFRFIVPFVRTPTRILEFAIDRTPPGAAFNLRTAFKKTSSELTTADATVKAEAVGRLAFSVMTLATFGMYASSGMITGAGPENKAERDAWLAAGNQPYSIRMGDNWVSYRRLDPFASMVGMIVDFFNAAEDGHSKGNPALENVSHALVIGLSNNLTNKSYLTGLTNLVNAINDPNRYGQDFVNQYVSALVPFSSALRQSKDTAGDLVVRDIRTMFDAIKNTVPGAAAGVSPRRNILGEPVTKASSGMAGIDLFNPFSYTKVSDDLIFNEMNNIGHAFAAPREVKAGMTLPEIVGASGQNAYDRWQELHGTVLVGGKTLRQALTKLIRSRDYQRMSPESNDVYDSPRVRAMRMVVDRYRNAAFKQLMKEFPEVAQGVKNDFAVKKAMRTGRPVQELMDLVNR